MAQAYNIFTWPHKVSASRIVCQFVVPSDPVTKHRARTVHKDGRVVTYTPQATKQAEENIRAYFLSSKRRLFEDDTSRFGIRIFFHKKNQQRRDLDNMAKLVMDALTKLAWEDDAQVDEVILKRFYDKDNPRTEILVHALPLGGELIQKIACALCGKLVRTYPSIQARGKGKMYCSRRCVALGTRQRTKLPCDNCGKEIERVPARLRTTKRVYCNRKCMNAALTVALVCAYCSNDFRRARSSMHSGRKFCGRECQASYWREHRKAAAVGVCMDCGGPTSKKAYLRCAACFVLSKRFRSPGHPVGWNAR